VLGFFTKSMELSSGTLKVDVDDVVADGDRVVVFSTVSAQRNGRSLSTPEVHCWRLADGKAVEFREFQGDQQSEDVLDLMTGSLPGSKATDRDPK
jgi:uncharacterized protein